MCIRDSARTHRQLELIESCLRHDDIPCLTLGREDYLEDEAVGGALAFFRSLLYPADSRALAICLKSLWQCPASMVVQAQEAWHDGPDPAVLRERIAGAGPLEKWLEALIRYLPLSLIHI